MRGPRREQPPPRSPDIAATSAATTSALIRLFLVLVLFVMGGPASAYARQAPGDTVPSVVAVTIGAGGGGPDAGRLFLAGLEVERSGNAIFPSGDVFVGARRYFLDIALNIDPGHGDPGRAILGLGPIFMHGPDRTRVAGMAKLGVDLRLSSQLGLRADFRGIFNGGAPDAGLIGAAFVVLRIGPWPGP